MGNLSFFLFIAAIVAAISSGSIDRAAKAEGQLKRLILIISLAVICILLLPLIFQLLWIRAAYSSPGRMLGLGLHN